MLSYESISFRIYLDFALHLDIVVSVIDESVRVHAIVVVDVLEITTVVDNVRDLVVLLEEVGVLREGRSSLFAHWATIHIWVFGNLLDMIHQRLILLTQKLLLRNRLFNCLRVESLSENVYVRTVKLLVLR